MLIKYVDLNSLSSITEPGSFVRLNIHYLNRIGFESFGTLVESDKVSISFLVRSPVTDIMNIITDSPPTTINNKRILTGPPGCGKSSSIYQIVQYCKLNGWIVFYMPKCEKLMFDDGKGEITCMDILDQVIRLNKDIFDKAS